MPRQCSAREPCKRSNGGQSDRMASNRPMRVSYIARHNIDGGGSVARRVLGDVSRPGHCILTRGQHEPQYRPNLQPKRWRVCDLLRTERIWHLRDSRAARPTATSSRCFDHDRVVSRPFRPLGPLGLHERQAVFGELDFAFEHASPDFRGGGERRAARGRTLRSSASRRSRLRLSVSNVSFQWTWPWPGVLRSFSEMWTWTRCLERRADRVGDVLFLDVGVERVVHHPAVRMLDRFDEPDRVGDAGEQIGLEAVEILDAEHHAAGFGVLGDCAHAFDAPIPFVLGRALPLNWPSAE